MLCVCVEGEAPRTSPIRVDPVVDFEFVVNVAQCDALVVVVTDAGHPLVGVVVIIGLQCVCVCVLVGVGVGV